MKHGNTVCLCLSTRPTDRECRHDSHRPTLSQRSGQHSHQRTTAPTLPVKENSPIVIVSAGVKSRLTLIADANEGRFADSFPIPSVADLGPRLVLATCNQCGPRRLVFCVSRSVHIRCTRWPFLTESVDLNQHSHATSFYLLIHFCSIPPHPISHIVSGCTHVPPFESCQGILGFASSQS